MYGSTFVSIRDLINAIRVGSRSILLCPVNSEFQVTFQSRSSGEIELSVVKKLPFIRIFGKVFTGRRLSEIGDVVNPLALPGRYISGTSSQELPLRYSIDVENCVFVGVFAFTMSCCHFESETGAISFENICPEET